MKPDRETRPVAGEDGARLRRSRRSILLELLVWALLSLAVAVAMVILSEKYLPTNF